MFVRVVVVPFRRTGRCAFTRQLRALSVLFFPRARLAVASDRLWLLGRGNQRVNISRHAKRSMTMVWCGFRKMVWRSCGHLLHNSIVKWCGAIMFGALVLVLTAPFGFVHFPEQLRAVTSTWIADVHLSIHVFKLVTQVLPLRSLDAHENDLTHRVPVFVRERWSHTMVVSRKARSIPASPTQSESQFAHFLPHVRFWEHPLVERGRDHLDRQRSPPPRCPPR